MRLHEVTLKRYRIAVWLLSVIVIIQAILVIILIRPKKVPRVPVVIKGKIAIVLDDWGYNLNNLYILDDIRYPLTMSVLPNLSYSKEVSSDLHRRGFEVILHLPMEPKEKVRLEKNTIMISMAEATIRGILTQALANVAYTKGVSNHMGSRATEDSRTMAIIFRELKKRKLYFLDSLVSSQSLGFDLAHKMRIGFAKRDIFLDNSQDAAYIKGQIYKLKTRARIYGQAIGVGHDRKITLEVLKEAMPQLTKEGYKLVFVSELIK